MLIKELLKESTNRSVLETIEAVLDGKFPAGSKSQADNMLIEDGKTLFYVATYDPEEYSDVEAYVILDQKTNKLSFREESSGELCIDGEMLGHRRRNDEIEKVIEDYRFESGKPKSGAIEALYNALKNS